LAMLLKTNQTGLIETPNRILIPGQWIDGVPSTAEIGLGERASA